MKDRIITVLIVTGSLMLLSAGLAFRPMPDVIPDLEGKMEDYYRRYPQQKVYLHMDRIAYHAGETLWYRAYLVDARTHRPDTISMNLVVELIDSYGNISLIQILKLENGMASGDFNLPDTLQEGLYQVRAYTNWMRNFGEEYYFHREISIWNPQQYLNLYREDKLASKKHKRKSSRKAQKLDVRFFPEGGYLVGGVNCRVGFKAVNELGLGIPVSGTLYDHKKNPVTSFESRHLGMGAFTFTPETGQKYTAEILTENGKQYKLKMPEVQPSGYYLQLVGNHPEAVRVRMGSTFENATVLLACHVRGKLQYASEFRLGTEPVELDIPTRGFPEGILHITLFDSNRQPRCERLTYVHADDILDLTVRQDKSVYGKMQAVELTLQARDASGAPVQGRFSISVSDRDLPNNAGDFQGSILASLLLSSDIPGRIEHPDYYLRKREAETAQALDYLMLTQGWRRFAWDDILNERSREIRYPIQKGLLVTGKITKEIFGIPLKNLPVTLTVLSEFNDVFITRTDNRGRYEFELPDYEDTIQVEITARRLNGKKNLVIYIDDNDLEARGELFSSYASEMTVRGTNTLRPIPERERDSMQQTLEGIYHTPDFVLYVDENMESYRTVLEMIQGRIPGVQVSGNSVQIRGPSSLSGSNDPLFLIDNVPTDVNAVQSLNPVDVERIEVLKGPSSAIYGVRGANGVIAIFTKRGRFLIKGILTFDMLGYHRPREFYSPVYGTEFDDLVTDNRSTLYWNPSVQTDSTGVARLRFYTSEKASRFYVVSEGLTREGKIGFSERSFEVR